MFKKKKTDMISNMFGNQKPLSLVQKNAIAKLCKVSPDAFAEFERKYLESSMSSDCGVFDEDSKSKVKRFQTKNNRSKDLDVLTSDIASEFTNNITMIDTKNTDHPDFKALTDDHDSYKSTNAEKLNTLPDKFKPQLAKGYVTRQTNSVQNDAMLIDNYIKSKRTDLDGSDKHRAYCMFRQGLDLLDLTPIMYEMLSLNPNSMSYWLPSIQKVCNSRSFFKIPETRIVKVPIEILQMSRLDFESLTEATKQVINKFCIEAFELDKNNQYFIKTGTFSSKFDFRNAKITDPAEVLEIGEYLTFLSNQAVTMLNPLQGTITYGVSTTNEWVVREYIHDVENNPTIYNGMPLRTEFRVFVDFDTKEVIGINPYWDEDVMKNRFSKHSDANTPKMVHDYVVFTAHASKLKDDYDKYKNKVEMEVKELLYDCDLKGQWSIDIMKNGDDFYLIDMALAVQSAHKECVTVPLKEIEENWLPDFSKLKTIE